MVTPENSLDRLKSLGVFMSPEVVMTIVRHLKNGGVQRALYNATPGIKPVASNKTVLKVKTLLDAGKLDWMTDELDRLDATIDTVLETSDKDQQRLIKRIKGWDIAKDDGLGESRLKIVEKAENALEDRVFEWSIAHLKEIGFPLKDALETLQEYDALYMDRVTAEVSGNDYRYLLKFRGFDDYLTLLHRVYLMKKYPNSPIPYMDTAIVLYTKGMIEGDESVWTAGENILRYAIWDEGDSLKAYYNSLKLYKRTPKANKELRGHITQLVEDAERGLIQRDWLNRLNPRRRAFIRIDLLKGTDDE